MANFNYHIMNTANGIPDIQRDWMWEMRFVDIDTIVPMATTEDLRIRVRTASIPGANISAIDSTFMGTKWYFPGKKEVVSEMTCQFEETEDHWVYSVFHSWLNLIQQTDHEGDNAGVSQMPAKRQGLVVPRAYLNLLSYDGQVTRRINLFNIWPMSISAPSLGYESSGKVQYDVNFKFDNHTVGK